MDLAGSERIKNHENPTKETLKETVGINKSLMTLRQVVGALASR